MCMRPTRPAAQCRAREGANADPSTVLYAAVCRCAIRGRLTMGGRGNTFISTNMLDETRARVFQAWCRGRSDWRRLLVMLCIGERGRCGQRSFDVAGKAIKRWNVLQAARGGYATLSSCIPSMPRHWSVFPPSCKSSRLRSRPAPKDGNTMANTTTSLSRDWSAASATDELYSSTECPARQFCIY
ncbi:hypothetical protein CC80DRAFT_201031 [Byssothecium circinans]|uniref:Uncharacterized protein n=1 Tax=Byssothecium circinans TaxID=147558 RepID=A0A6A5UAP3_9PLEO|nr:hypothetical protein CC80DRAFT_201031 [Byssothecium circinans]